MKGLKAIGLAIILIIILSIVPVESIRGEEQQIQTVDFYKIILSRALDIPDLSPELKEKINNLLASKPKTAEEIRRFMEQAKDILKEVEKIVEVKIEVSDVIEQRKLTLVITTLISIARNANATILVKSLSKAMEMVKKGDIKGAKNILSTSLRDIEEIRVKWCSEAVERSAVKAFERIPTNETAIGAIMMAITNINMTIDVLKTLKERLIQINASESAIEALEKAMDLLNSTTMILGSVAEIVRIAGAESRAGNITKAVAVKKILNEISELEEDVSELLNKTEVLEQQLNITLSGVKDILSEAMIMLNETESLAAAGKVGEAMRMLTHIKSLIKSVERTLERYEKMLEEQLRRKGKLREYIIEKLEGLNETYQELLLRYEGLYKYAVEINATQVLNLLVEVNNTLNNLSKIIIEIHIKIENEAYEDAVALIDRAKSIIKVVDKLLDRAEDLLSTVLEIVEEILEAIDELREELEDLREEAEELFTDELLEIALEKINELINYLNNAENLAKTGNIDEAGRIVREIRGIIIQLGDCIDVVGELLEKIMDLRGKIDDLREKYQDNEEIQKKLDEAERLLDDALSELKEAIKNIVREPIIKAKKIIMEVEHIIEKIEETYRVKFKIIDSKGRPILMATVIFDEEEYHHGGITYKPAGTYDLEVGEIPEGYLFDHWESEGDIIIKDASSSTTEAVVNGEGNIILILKEKPAEEKYTITFYIKDVDGNPVAEATIIFDEEEYHYGDTTEISKGKYPLRAGDIPEEYSFKGWISEGDIIIMKPNSMETEVVVNGDGAITMVLGKKIEKKTYMLIFYIRDEEGTIIEDASIIFNGEIYYSGDRVKIQEGDYTISVGEIPSNYVFNHWEINGDIEIEDPLSQTTTVKVSGNGEVILILKKKIEEMYTVKFYIKDIDGNTVSEATIIFDEEEYTNGEEVLKAAGEYPLLVGEVPEGYQFKNWIAEGMIVISDLNSPETTATVKGEGSIILILEKIKEEEKYTVKFYVKDTYGNIVGDATIIFNDIPYSSGDETRVTEGTYKLSIGTIPENYKFKMWASEGEVVIKNMLSEDTEALVKGNGTITLILEQESEEATITFYIKDTEGNMIPLASIKFNGEEYLNGQTITVEQGEYSIEAGTIPQGYKFKRWEKDGEITIKDESSQKTEVTVSGDGALIMILEKSEETGQSLINMQGNCTYKSENLLDYIISPIPLYIKLVKIHVNHSIQYIYPEN